MAATPKPEVPPLPERRRLSRDPFQQRMDAAAALTVDVNNLVNVSEYLAVLASAARTEIKDTLKRADAAMHVGRYKESVLGGENIAEVPPLDRRVHGLYEVVDANIDDVVRALEETAKAVRQIARDYKAAEDLNHLSAASVKKVLPR